jgi:uncharacterized protein YcfL
MKSLVLITLLYFLLLVLAGCTQPGTKPRDDPNAAVVERMDAVRNTGSGKAVLSLHKRKAFPDACTYGITLTNNLDKEIVNIAFRFSAYINGGVFHSYETKSFFGLKPTESKYREMNFRVPCDKIDYLKVSDPGRCAVGKTMTRYSTNPGDCIRLVDVASSPYVRLVQ